MQHYATTLAKPEELEATIELLEHSSKMITLFLDRQPLCSAADPRIGILEQAADYFSQFQDAPATQSFTSATTYDINCTVNGLLELIRNSTKQGLPLVPSLLNSDVIENHFCMVRALFNGGSDHPSYFIYKNLQNAVILTQPVALPSNRNANTTNSYIQLKL